MWFDCVVGETGEPGRHFRANLAQQHLPPSFAGDRLGTAGRWKVAKRERGGQGGEAGLIPVLARSPLKRRRGGGVCLHVHFLPFFQISFF